ncbi:PP2C family protein-serine/threonine phosphatase [Bradyrhizobium sp. USDA 4508]
MRVGFASETGKRAANEDYVAACLGQPGTLHRDVVAAVADGVGGHKGGREAAEVAVRSFIDAYYSLPETLGVRRRAARALEAANSWIYGQGRVDAARSGMACAFSSIILSRATMPCDPYRRHPCLSPERRPPGTPDAGPYRRPR